MRGMTENLAGRARFGTATITAFFLTMLLAFTAMADQLPKGVVPVPDRPVAPDFQLVDMDGEKTALSDFRGKVVVVNFWATWCPPCRYEIPALQRALEPLRDGDVALLTIHVGSDPDGIWAFIGDYDIQFPILIDPDSAVADAWPMPGLPTTFVIDPQGRIALRAIGGREWDDPATLETIFKLRQ